MIIPGHVGFLLAWIVSTHLKIIKMALTRILSQNPIVINGMGGKMDLSDEIKEKLLARRNEIITVAMGRTYYPEDGTYDFNNLGWFELHNWLTKEKSTWWIPLFEWIINDSQDLRISRFKASDFEFITKNLPQLFVEWLWATKAEWMEGDLLTPLGKLMKEIEQDEN